MHILNPETLEEIEWNYFEVFFFTIVDAAACFLRNLSRFLALLLSSDPLVPLELELLALLPLLALAVFKLVPCRDSLTLPEDDVLDLTTLLLPGTVEEEELFPDFSVLGSFNFSTPSASLFLKPASPRDPTRNFVFPEGDSNVVLGDAANALEERSRAALLGDPVNALEDRSRATVG